MNSSEFIKEFAEKANLTKKDAKEVVGAFYNVLVSHMRDEDGVTPFPGIKFTSTYMSERKGINPKTQEPISISAKYVPRVKFGKRVKEAIN